MFFLVASGTPIDKNHIDFANVFRFLNGDGYPFHLVSRGEKANFRRQCLPYVIQDGKLFYRKLARKGANSKPEALREVIASKEEQKNVIKIVHEGEDVSEEAKALSGHRGRDSTQRLLRRRFFWPNMAHDTRKYISECPVCQMVNPASLKVIPDLHPIPIPSKVMQQIGIDLIQLPEINGLKYAIIAIDYFSKWSEGRALPDKRAESVARFIYEDIICRHGCPALQINDQGREFVNSLSEQLHLLTGVKQRVTSAYHPQANGLVERQNRTIKNCLLKVLQDNVTRWPEVLPGVIFAHRSAVHSSTKYSPFFIMYQREPVLPVDVSRMEVSDLNEPPIDDNDADDVNIDMAEDEPFAINGFHSVLNSLMKLRDLLHDNVKINLDEAQEKQKRDYKMRHSSSHVYKVGDQVLVKNLRRSDRKGGWRMMPWIGPYSIAHVYSNAMVSLYSLNKKTVLKVKYHLHNIKPFLVRTFSEEGSKKDERKDNEASKGDREKDEKEHDDDGSDVEGKVDDDVEEISEGDDDYKYTFLPIDEIWQKSQCKRLGLKLIDAKPTSSNMPISLTKPLKTDCIRGDGNCWFRSLSMCITGSETNHKEVRQKLCEYMTINPKVQHYIGAQNVNTYLIEKKMMKDRTWATDIEIYASALLLETDVYVFLNSAWQRFSKTGILRDIPDIHERSVYINNVNANHYEVVRSVHVVHR